MNFFLKIKENLNDYLMLLRILVQQLLGYDGMQNSNIGCKVCDGKVLVYIENVR